MICPLASVYILHLQIDSVPQQSKGRPRAPGPQLCLLPPVRTMRIVSVERLTRVKAPVAFPGD